MRKSLISSPYIFYPSAAGSKQSLIINWIKTKKLSVIYVLNH